VKTILVSAGVSLILALFGTPLAIRVFTRRGYGQLIREEGPAAHATKRGTPTMGGTVIVVATLIGYFVGHVATSDPMSASGLLVLMLMAGLGLVGFIDDFIKIYKQTSLGLRSGAKLAGQAVVGGLFALLVVNSRLADGYDLTPADAHLSFLRDFGPSIGVAPFVLWIMFLIAGTSNAVNLTDGLDGLATGAATLVLAAYVLIANWQLRNDCTVALAPHCYAVASPLDLAVVAAAALGACFGFLWWNAPPARIFMGDTGSMLLGLLLAYGPLSSNALLDQNILVNYASATSHPVNRFATILPLLLPVAILIIPYTDLLLAVVRRMRAGKSPFSADRQHLHHRLQNMGHSHRQTVLLMYLWAALFSGTVVGLSVIRVPLIWLALATVGAMIALLLATMPRLRPWRSTGRRGAGSRRHRRVTVTPVRSSQTASATTGQPAAARGPIPDVAPPLLAAPLAPVMPVMPVMPVAPVVPVAPVAPPAPSRHARNAGATRP
jgi:phospho-N-acetylmuramoyl-pentapeptide-transferase